MDNFAERLLRWFDEHGRKHLPWQQDTSAYRVWVSEIMLQQTQVTTVIPYYLRFMEAFPSVDQLAAATEDEVLHLWTGLGYYARGRNLHKTAKKVMSDFNGEFPATVEELCALPGIGRSTAGAIIAISSNTRAPILDGNVKRVLARCFGIEGWPGTTSTQKALWEKAELLTPNSRAADYTQAIMDIGATLCTRSSPGCERCPFSQDCVALAENRIHELPGKKPKVEKPVRVTDMLVIENQNGEFLLEKRPSEGLWGGLWSFPETGETTIEDTLAKLDVKDAGVKLGTFRHTFTHFHLDITPVHVKLTHSIDQVQNQPTCWYSVGQPEAIGLTKPATKLLKELSRGSNRLL